MDSFDKIINQWLSQYPKGQIPIESQARIDALTNLFQAFKDAGYPMEYFSNTVKGKITSNCINPNHPNKRKKNTWIQYVAKHMQMAFYSIYDGNATMEENDLVAPATVMEDVTDLPEEVEEKKPKEAKLKKEKVEYFAENAPKGSETNNEIDPEMAKLLGLDK
jgi:UDP-N-acetylglucosamine 2-epimerase